MHLHTLVKVRNGTSTGSVTVGNAGQSLAVYQNLYGSGPFTATSSAIFANNASFTFTADGALTYVTAVPEADSWAMMLLGLGFMGFAARRKQA